MRVDTIRDFIADNWYLGLAIVVILVGPIVIYGFDDFRDFLTGADVVEVEIVSDDGVYITEGSGKYHKGDRVELSASVFIGWFFEGWYDSEGNLLGDDWRDTTWGTYEFVITESCTIHAKSERGYGINLYKMPGIENVYGRGTYGFDEDATVFAEVHEGYFFTGWYDLDGNMISSSRTITLTERTDDVLIACSNAPNFYLGDSLIDIPSDDAFTSNGTFGVILNERTGEMVASHVGTNGWSIGLSPGLYTYVFKGFMKDGTYGYYEKPIRVDGVSVNIYDWDFKGRSYTLPWLLDMSTYENSVSNDKGRYYFDPGDCTAFVNYDSDDIRSISAKLTDKSQGMTDLERANFVLKFVQLCTEYQYDEDYNGHTEYVKYPLETLFEGKGDCEDTALLYCALMKAMGYDCALLVYTGEEYIGRGHVAAAVALDSVPGGTYYEKDGLRFFYCETTSDTMVVGEMWDDYDSGQVVVIP